MKTVTLVRSCTVVSLLVSPNGTDAKGRKVHNVIVYDKQ